MKTLMVLLFVAAVIAALALLLGARQKAEAHQDLPSDPKLMAMLRLEVLSGKFFADESKQSPEQGANAAAMDWASESCVVTTLVAFQDGTVSLYSSTGGAILGLGEEKRVRESAARFLEIAKSSRGHLSRTDSFTYPSAGHMNFYLVETTSTLSSGPIPDQDLRKGRHSLSQLAYAAQDVITQIRKTSG
jgi:hypothetical protein